MAAFSQSPEPAFATGCTFRLAADGVSGADYTATEGEGPGGGFHIVVEKLTVGCSGQANLSFVSGSAIPPGDYSVTGTIGLPFASGVTTRELNIFPNDDAVSGESPETFTVNLTVGGDDFTTSPTSQVLTILDNDGPPSFSFSLTNYPVVEGTPNVVITVNRSGAVGQPVSVDYSTIASGLAASPGDFTAIAATPLNFLASDTSKTFNVQITNDGVGEPTETFSVHLSNPSGSGSVGSDATITITDDDGAGTLQFSSGNYSVTEGQTANVLVTRTGGTTGTVTVNCSTSGKQQRPSATIRWSATRLSPSPRASPNRWCAVLTAGDSVQEPAETVGLALSSPGGGATLGLAAATVTIDDDDGTGQIVFHSTSYAGLENGGPITITVDRTSGTGGGSVTYTTSNGPAPSATAGVDYTATTGQLTWGSGDLLSKTFTVSPINDSSAEGAENVTLTLSAHRRPHPRHPLHRHSHHHRR